MDLMSNLLSDSSELLHTDQVFLKTPDEMILTSVTGENGHNEEEINAPITDFKNAYETIQSRILTLDLPDKKTCLENMSIYVDDDEEDEIDEISCAVSMIPGQLGLIEAINGILAGYSRYDCKLFLQRLNEDTCRDSFCVGKEMMRFDNDDDVDVDIPVLHPLFVYYPLVRTRKDIDPVKFLDKLVNYATVYEKMRNDAGSSLKCFMCTMFARNNADLLIGKPGDPLRLVRYLNCNFIDTFTPLESIAVRRNAFFRRIQIYLRGDKVWTCRIKSNDGSRVDEYS